MNMTFCVVTISYGGTCTGDRVNDIHLTNAVKMELRKAKEAKS